jgi:hypothetical protein
MTSERVGQAIAGDPRSPAQTRGRHAGRPSAISGAPVDGIRVCGVSIRRTLNCTEDVAHGRSALSVPKDVRELVLARVARIIRRFLRPHASHTFVSTIAILVAAPADGRRLDQTRGVPAGWLAVRPDQLQWTRSQDVDIAPVFGRRDRADLFAVAIRFPPHTMRRAHTHSALRYGVVLPGTFYQGHGDRFDDATLERRAAGTFFTEPAGVPPFGAT